MSLADDIFNEQFGGGTPAKSEAGGAINFATHKADGTPRSLQEITDRAVMKSRLDAEHVADSSRMEAQTTEDMGTDGRFLAGVGKGMADIGHGLGNMVGLVDDETLADRKTLDASLMSTTAGKVGDFVGEMAATAPLGIIGKGGKLIGAGKTALLEGAAVGGITADPGSRVRGAVQGAATGLALNKSLAAASRVAKDGVIKVSPHAEALVNRLRQPKPKGIGRESFIPAVNAADPSADMASSLGTSFGKVANMLPAAGNRAARQSDELGDDVHELLVNHNFARKVGDQPDLPENLVSESLRANKGNMRGVIDEAVREMPLHPRLGPDGNQVGKEYDHLLSQSQKELSDSANRVDGQIDMKALAEKRMARADDGYGSSADDVSLLTDANKILGAKQSYGVAERSAYHGTENALGRTATISPSLSWLVANKGSQNFSMGNTGWQRGMRDMMDAPEGKAVRKLMSGVRRTASAVEGNENPMQKYKESAQQNAERQAANALRSIKGMF